MGRSLDMVMKAVFAAMISLGQPIDPSFAARAACVVGSDRCPILLDFRSRSGRIVVRGRLAPDRSRYSYAFEARAGQKLTWKFEGPTARTVIRYPTGATDGPSLPNIILLPVTGGYVLTISSNSMAEDIFGPFRLTLRLR